MVCQECGVNTMIVRGHSKACSQYAEPALSPEELDSLDGLNTESADKLRAFGDAVSEVVIDRGEKSIIGFLSTIGITQDDPAWEEMRPLAQMCLAVGAGITIQVMIEQDILDEEGLIRAAGL